MYAGARLFGSSSSGAAQFAWEDLQKRVDFNIKQGSEAKTVVANYHEYMLAASEADDLAAEAEANGDTQGAADYTAKAAHFRKLAAESSVASETTATSGMQDSASTSANIERISNAIFALEDKLADDPDNVKIQRELIIYKKQLDKIEGYTTADRVEGKDQQLDNSVTLADHKQENVVLNTETDQNNAIIREDNSTANKIAVAHDTKIANYVEEQTLITEKSMLVASKGEQMLRVIIEGDPVTGVFGNIAGAYNRLLTGMGFKGNEDGAATFDALQGMQFEFVKEQMDASKGSITEREMTMFFAASPGIEKTVGGLKLLIATMVAVADANVARNDHLNAWYIECSETLTCTLPKKNRAMAEYDRANPMSELLPSQKDVDEAAETARIEDAEKSSGLQSDMSGFNNYEELAAYVIENRGEMSTADLEYATERLTSLKQ